MILEKASRNLLRRKTGAEETYVLSPDGGWESIRGKKHQTGSTLIFWVIRERKRKTQARLCYYSLSQ